MIYLYTGTKVCNQRLVSWESLLCPCVVTIILFLNNNRFSSSHAPQKGHAVTKVIFGAVEVVVWKLIGHPTQGDSLLIIYIYLELLSICLKYLDLTITIANVQDSQAYLQCKVLFSQQDSHHNRFPLTDNIDTYCIRNCKLIDLLETHLYSIG